VGTWCTEDETGLNELLFRFRGVDPEIVPLLDLPLSDAERLARYVAPELGEKQVNDVARLGGGRPGRIVELLRALEGRPVLSAPLGPSLEELLRRRVRELSPAEQRTLILLALGGGQLGLPVLSELLGCGVLEASGLVRSLEERGLAGVEGDTAVVTSTLLREFVQRELPGPLRRETHAHMADVLLRMPGETDPGLVAHHLMEAGRSVEAADWFKRAGIQARDRTAFAEAMVLLERSVAANDQLDPEIAQALGSIHSGMGDFKQAIHWFGRARLGYVDRGDQVGDVETALQEIGVEVRDGMDQDSSFKSIRSEYARVSRLRRPELISAVLETWLKVADHFHHRESVDEALGHLRRHLKSDQAPREFAFVGARLTYLGSPEEGLRLARKSYLESRGKEDSRHLDCLHRLLLCLWARGLFTRHRASILVGRADHLATGFGNLPSRIALWSALALWHLDTGQWLEAESCLSRASSGMVLPAEVQRGAMAVNHAILCLRTGDFPGAEEQLEVLGGRPQVFGRTIEVLSNAVRLLVALESGRLSEARSCGRTLEDCDLSFPFASNLALVPEARAELMRRQGHRHHALDYLRDSLRVMGGANVPCERQLAKRIAELERYS
jgi:tetratricopeptide (TPR) repeat protein